VSTRKQAQKHDSLPLRIALLHRKMSVSRLAKLIRHPRPTVSAALNRGKFPRVLAKIRHALRDAN
jgi:hypothetical protein